MIELDLDNFKEEVLESNIPTLVVFWRPGCGACSVVLPLIDEIDKEMNGEAKFAELNILYATEIAKEYKVPAVPTLIIFKNGEVKERAVGLRPKQALIDKMRSLV